MNLGSRWPSRAWARDGGGAGIEGREPSRGGEAGGDAALAAKAVGLGGAVGIARWLGRRGSGGDAALAAKAVGLGRAVGIARRLGPWSSGGFTRKMHLPRVATPAFGRLPV